MSVIQAESAGFCYGVERAVKIAEETAREKGGCVMLGSIIHNAHVVQELERSGVRCVNRVEEVQPGDTVIIRSHGERKQVLDRLAEIGAQCVNATCPNVRLAQKKAAQAAGRPGGRGGPYPADHRGRASSGGDRCGQLVRAVIDL